jgi:hypothetical protein
MPKVIKAEERREHPERQKLFQRDLRDITGTLSNIEVFIDGKGKICMQVRVGPYVKKMKIDWTKWFTKSKTS